MLKLSRYIALCLTLLLGSCTERIDINLPTSLKRLVVDGKLTIDPMMHTITLSETMDYFTANPTITYIGGASLQITEVETSTVYTLREDPNAIGHYRTESDVAGKQGYHYKLQIEGVDIDKDGIKETYEATDFLPYIGDRIDSIKLVYGYSLLNEFLGFPLGGDTGWNTLLYVQDAPTHEYYIIISSRNDVTFSHVENRGFFDDEIFGTAGKSVYLNGVPMAFLPDSTEYQVNIGDIVGMTIQSTSANYFRYLEDVENASSGGNHMAGNPANVRGNVNNGAIGYFATYSSRSAWAVAKSTPRFSSLHVQRE